MRGMRYSHGFSEYNEEPCVDEGTLLPSCEEYSFCGPRWIQMTFELGGRTWTEMVHVSGMNALQSADGQSGIQKSDSCFFHHQCQDDISIHFIHFVFPPIAS